MLANAAALNGFSWWWVVPLAMMILCFLMMRGKKGCMTAKRAHRPAEGSAREILDKRYVTGEIGREEYEEKKRDITP